MEKPRPLIEVQNYKRHTHVMFAGVDFSKAIYAFEYIVKKKKGKTALSPRLRLEIDVCELVQLLEKLNEDDISRVMDTLELYFQENTLLKEWRSQMQETEKAKNQQPKASPLDQMRAAVKEALQSHEGGQYV